MHLGLFYDASSFVNVLIFFCHPCRDKYVCNTRTAYIPRTSSANINRKHFIVVINLSFDLVRFAESKRAISMRLVMLGWQYMMCMCVWLVGFLCFSSFVRFNYIEFCAYVWRIVYSPRRSSLTHSYYCVADFFISFIYFVVVVVVLVHNWRDKRFNYNSCCFQFLFFVIVVVFSPFRF